jgi:hypothetical protein
LGPQNSKIVKEIEIMSQSYEKLGEVYKNFQLLIAKMKQFKFFVGLHGNKSYDSFICGNTT